MGRHRKHADDNARKRAYNEKKRQQRREANKLQVRQKRKSLSESEKLEYNRRNKLYVKRCRERKRVENQSEQSSTTLGYQSRQGLGKAVKKTTASLPCSPAKRKQVLRIILRNVCIDDKSPNSEPWNKLSDSDIQKVRDFYSSELITWSSPNMRDSINSKGERVSRVYLSMTLREAYALFLEKFTSNTGPISFSKFCSLRPDNVKLWSQIPAITCVCKYCFNFKELLESLKSILSFRSIKSFIESTCCSEGISEECMLIHCNDCDETLKLYEVQISDDIRNSPTAYSPFTWTTVDGKPEKVRVSVTNIEAIEKLKAEFSRFKAHYFVKKSQALHFQEARASISNSRAVLQVDYAENYSCSVQDEIQQHHFSGGPQISVFTACVWRNGESSQLALISDCLQHDIYSTFVCLSKLLQWIMARFEGLNEIEIFSDGAPSQFKNRFMFRMISEISERMGLVISWSFFASSHGKGVVDAIGGKLKAHVRRLVLSRRAQVNCASDFIQHSQQVGVNLLSYTKREVADVMKTYTNDWKTVTMQVKDITKQHFYKSSEENSCTVKQTSTHPSEKKICLVK